MRMQRRKGNGEERPIRVGGGVRGWMAGARPCGRTTKPSDGYASQPATGLIDVAKTNIFRSYNVLKSS